MLLAPTALVVQETRESSMRARFGGVACGVFVPEPQSASDSKASKDCDHEPEQACARLLSRQ